MFSKLSKKRNRGLLSSIVLSGVVFGFSMNFSTPLIAEGAVAEKPSWTFSYKGAKENFTVPQSGNYSIEAYGAQGQSSGGLGGSSKGTMALKAGDVLSINVGGQNGYNGGGAGSASGGGASDVRLNGTSDANRLLSGAGGGGGSGGTVGGSDTGQGGATVGNSAGTNGVNGGGGGRSYNYSYSTGYWQDNGYWQSNGYYTTVRVPYEECDYNYGAWDNVVCWTLYRNEQQWVSTGSTWVSTGSTWVNTGTSTSQGLPGKGGTNFMSPSMQDKSLANGVRTGDGMIKITQLISPPQITLTKNPQDNQIYGNGDALEISGSVKDTDDDGATMKVMYTIDGGPAQTVLNVATSKTDIPFTIKRDLTSELSSGSHSLRLWSTDETGNIGSEFTYAFTVKEKPTLTLTKDLANNKINVAWDFDLTNQTMTYNLYRSTNGVDFTKVMSKTSSKSLSDIDAKDTASPTDMDNVNVSKTGATNYLAFNPSTDKGISYTYYVEAIRASDNKTYRSINVTEEMKDNTVGYSYVVDDKPTTDVDKTIDTKTTSNLIDVTKFEYAQAYYVHVRAIDGKGNASPIVHKRILTGKPTIAVTLSKSSWTNDSVTIQVTANSSTSSIQQIDLPDGTQIMGNTASYVVSQNGIYPFVAYDATGNMTVEFVEINKIDKSNPTIDLVTPADWKNTDIDIEINATP